LGARCLAEIELVKSGDSFSKRELEAPLEGLAAAGDFKLYVDGAEVIALKADKGSKAIRPRALFSQQRRFTEETQCDHTR
jgi:hypothetical protein